MSNSEVVGLVYVGLADIREIQVGEGVLPYTSPTSHALAVSNFFVRRALDQFRESAPKESADELAQRVDFKDYLEQATVRMMVPRDTTSGMMRPLEPSAG